MTAQERKEKIDRIRLLPKEVEETIRGLSDGQLDTPYSEGKWTVRQVVHHLADSHMNAFVRMKLMVTEHMPTLKPYNQDEWAKLHDSSKLPVQSSLSILKGLHDRWCALLDHLPEEMWARKANHPEHGEVSMESMLNTYAGHGRHHVEQIRSLKKAKGW